MSGCTRQRLAKMFGQSFHRKLGLISTTEHIEVNNSLLSAVLHENPQL